MGLTPMGNLAKLLMWQQQPDYARYKEKSNGESWLFNRQEGTLIQIKPDAATKHAQFVLVSYYRLSARLGNLYGSSGCSGI